jgi:hypothetical protein
MALRSAAALLLCAGAAFAGDETNTAVGKMHYETGQQLYRDKRYAEALSEFTQGYDLTQRPAFLINIAQTYRMLGDRKKALEFYRTYLVFDSTSSMADNVRTVMQEIEAEAAREPAAPAPPTVTPKPPRRVVTWVGLSLTAALLASSVATQSVAYTRGTHDVDICNSSIGCNEDFVGAEALTITNDYHAAYALWSLTGVFAAATLVAGIVETKRIQKAQAARVAAAP